MASTFSPFLQGIYFFSASRLPSNGFSESKMSGYIRKFVKRLRTQNRGVSDEMGYFKPKNSRGEAFGEQIAPFTGHIMRTYHERIENV